MPALALLAPAPARATDVQVSPVVVELDARARSAILTVKNGSQEKARYQVSAFSWAQDSTGKMELLPMRDLAVFPLLLEIAPGQSRNIRIGLSTAPDGVEKTYRVFVEELPPAESPEQSGQVRILMRVGVPVFVAPVKPVHESSVVFTAVGGGRASLLVRNTGTVRLRPTDVRLVGLDAAGSAAFTVPLNAWYVLAGDERAYETALPQEACARAKTLRAVLTEERGELEARIALPDGACAR
ncbi:MAG TPA: fimbria/pilus periplasmic chaperone [Anaeromyxobacteraceae bacterium]|nr:fimbria/pilus periplasmic chaperone [Anaeromyxobacteraceae bacterium]